MTRDEYLEYLKSDHWREFSKALKEQLGYRCEECGLQAEPEFINVHHLHYRTLWHESREDVKVYCERCHFNWHILARRMRMFGIKPTSGSFLQQRDYVMSLIERENARAYGLY
jgi:DNA-directed RNA polymerase subunit RPC12/RpoP